MVCFFCCCVVLALGAPSLGLVVWFVCLSVRDEWIVTVFRCTVVMAPAHAFTGRPTPEPEYGVPPGPIPAASSLGTDDVHSTIFWGSVRSPPAQDPAAPPHAAFGMAHLRARLWCSTWPGPCRQQPWDQRCSLHHFGDLGGPV